MVEITNPKIERAKTEASKTRAKIAEMQAKLREQERQIKAYEDLEIVARFRSERYNEDAPALLRSLNKAKSSVVEMASVQKEETEDASIKEN
jgi:hypothetical protein